MSQNLGIALAVFAGGGVGSVMRHYSVVAAKALLGEGFPYGTLFVNIVGCFVIGALVEAFALRFNAPPPVQALLVTGFLGGFTTFSAFSLDFFKLVQEGALVPAATYAAVTFIICLLAVFGGVFLMRGVLG